MSHQKYVLADPASACAAAAERIASLLNAATDNAPTATLAVSGGRTPAALFDSLAANGGVDWQRVHLFLADERAVPPDNEQSNYRLALTRLIEPSGLPPANVHRIAGETPPHEAARRYGHDIRAFFGPGAQDLPRFDVIQLGVGGDGHIASLFPGDPYLENRENVVAAVYSDPAAQWRITLLPGVLLAAGCLVVLACGEDKAEPLRLAWHSAYNPMRCPVQLIAREGERVDWFLDLAAAAKLG
jgi:6-phosphogluconolactonase